MSLPTKLISELVKRTALSERMLVEAWDALGPETRITILWDYVGREVDSIPRDLARKALADAQPFVRFLAARSYLFDEKDALDVELLARLRNDSSELVRGAAESIRLIGPGALLSVDAEILVAMPQVQRLLVVDHYVVNADELAQFVVKAHREGLLTVRELRQLLDEYCTSTRIRKFFAEEPVDGLDWVTVQSSFQAIWRLTLETPPEVHVPIIFKFPMTFAGSLRDRVPDDVIKGLPPKEVGWLLTRPDPGLEELREKVRASPDSFDKKIVEGVEDWFKVQAVRDAPPEDPIERRLHALGEQISALREVVDELHERAQQKHGLFG